MAGRKPNVARAQIDSPPTDVPAATTARDDLLQRLSVDDRRSSTERNAQAKGPFSGIVPGGESATTAAPSTTSSVPTGIFGGLPTGLPDNIPGGSAQDGQGQNPTLILGGFSILVVPTRGMSMADMASMLSAGQQFGQMVPKPSGGG